MGSPFSGSKLLSGMCKTEWGYTVDDSKWLQLEKGKQYILEIL